jgi:hypothetical protein
MPEVFIDEYIIRIDEHGSGRDQQHEIDLNPIRVDESCQFFVFGFLTITNNCTDPIAHATPTTDLPLQNYSVTASAHSSPAMPTVRCKVDNCNQDVELLKSTIRHHLTVTHDYKPYERGISVDCRWENCHCSKTRCNNRGVGHSVHVQDIAEHVWHAHLNFHEACSKCGDARWVHPYARSRHESKCTGPKPARCKRCRVEFSSVVALESHILFGQCFNIV